MGPYPEYKVRTPDLHWDSMSRSLAPWLPTTPLSRSRPLSASNAAGATGVICLKGETCKAVNQQAGWQCEKPDKSLVQRKIQKYAWMIPKIASNAKAEKFTICRSTNMQMQQCDATTSTSQAGNKPVCKDV